MRCGPAGRASRPAGERSRRGGSSCRGRLGVGPARRRLWCGGGYPAGLTCETTRCAASSAGRYSLSLFMCAHAERYSSTCIADLASRKRRRARGRRRPGRRRGPPDEGASPPLPCGAACAAAATRAPWPQARFPYGNGMGMLMHSVTHPAVVAVAAAGMPRERLARPPPRAGGAAVAVGCARGGGDGQRMPCPTRQTRRLRCRAPAGLLNVHVQPTSCPPACRSPGGRFLCVGVGKRAHLHLALLFDCCCGSRRDGRRSGAAACAHRANSGARSAPRQLLPAAAADVRAAPTGRIGAGCRLQRGGRYALHVRRRFMHCDARCRAARVADEGGVARTTSGHTLSPGGAGTVPPSPLCGRRAVKWSPFALSTFRPPLPPAYQTVVFGRVPSPIPAGRRLVRH